MIGESEEDDFIVGEGEGGIYIQYDDEQGMSSTIYTYIYVSNFYHKKKKKKKKMQNMFPLFLFVDGYHNLLVKLVYL